MLQLKKLLVQFLNTIMLVTYQDFYMDPMHTLMVETEKLNNENSLHLHISEIASTLPLNWYNYVKYFTQLLRFHMAINNWQFHNIYMCVCVCVCVCVRARARAWTHTNACLYLYLPQFTCSDCGADVPIPYPPVTSLTNATKCLSVEALCNRNAAELTSTAVLWTPNNPKNISQNVH
jgi:hypothetical protein